MSWLGPATYQSERETYQMTAWDPDAWTRNMIEDLRANGGTPSSGPLEGRPLAIMTTKGAGASTVPQT